MVYLGPTPDRARNAEIYALRTEGGVKTSFLAEKYGLTRSRICAIVQAERIRRAHTPEGLEAFGISNRLRNCLFNSGIRTPEELRAVPVCELLRIPNLGKVSVQELINKGLIDAVRGFRDKHGRVVPDPGVRHGDDGTEPA